MYYSDTESLFTSVSSLGLESDESSQSESETKSEQVSQDLRSLEFPYKRYFMRPVEYYYQNIFKLGDLFVKDRPFDFRNLITKQPLHEFKQMFPYTYNGHYMYIRDDELIYNTVNILTDYYNEKPRVQSIGHGESLSPYDYWQQNKNKIIDELEKQKRVTVYDAREYLYDKLVEARMGKISQYWALLNFFKVKRFLDPSSAWGDRLIAAIAYGCEYTGVDPNTDLKEGHDAIVKNFALENKEKYKMVYEPFENAIPEVKEEYFDFVLSSAAPYSGDRYNRPENQSIENYKEFDNWFISYMLVTCTKSYSALQYGGHFITTLLDRLYPTKYAIVELLLLSILYSCRDMHYKGILGWEASKGKVVPFWVFEKKIMSIEKTSAKIQNAAILLAKHYGDIFKKMEVIVKKNN
jgi:ABC-type amino acid transport substrate-binding protein